MSKSYKKILVASLFVLLFLAFYINRSYSHIFDYDASRSLLTVNLPREYTLNGGSGNKTVNYVALGDSLTYGFGSSGKESTFPYIVAKKLLEENKTVNVANLAVSGAVTEEVLQYQIPKALEKNPSLVTIMTGTNDVHDYVTKENFSGSLEMIIGELQSKTDAKIILINIPYLGTDSLILPPHDIVMNRRIQDFNEIIARIAKEKNVELVDIYSKSLTPFKQNQKLYYSIDEFHPSDDGYILWGNLINGN